MQLLSFLLLPLLPLLAFATPTLRPRATQTISTVTPSDVVVIFEQYPTWSISSWNYGALSRTRGTNARITLFTFYFADASPEWSKYTCKLGFKDPLLATGSGRAQLFSIGSNVTEGASWARRPFRDQHLGTLHAKGMGEGEATWEFGGYIKCPTAPYSRVGLELAPVGDDVVIEWQIPEHGIWVDVLKTV